MFLHYYLTNILVRQEVVSMYIQLEGPVGVPKKIQPLC